MTDTETLPKQKTWKDTLWSATKLILKIVVTSALLYYVFTQVPFQEVKQKLLHANYWWMATAVAVFFLSTVVSAWRLLSFFNSIELRLDPRFNFRLYLLGMFYNFLLPGGIGGDGYKIYLLTKNYKLPAKKVFWAILFDRLSGLWAIGLIIVALILFVPQVELHIAVPASVFLVGTALYYFITHRFFKEYTRYFVQGHGKAVLVQSLQVLTILCVLLGQNFDGKFAPYLLSFLISALAAVVPISLGGAGAREAIFTQLSVPFHMNVALAVFLSISFYIISLIVSLFGLYYVLRPSRLQEGLPSIEEEIKAESSDI
ncbi:lysylphosphatidylglycerol synthase transmembrane domain-containing protein [Mucilaginibacter aquatilis]|uniref:Flippase-like domain-containing protein n=1 Tax=Mucilaginibacter aquatilis TaxID=1517760 RepID=A0A6I4I5D5_9SPHI|nr:lysylphosphatidylglycerol synthase transmembrane domain-containing protein [Mucilaginibacter aquatilis]MVN90037.1 flippase-like domain-containing protein [Mucilaginibacter aquatilis]